MKLFSLANGFEASLDGTQLSFVGELMAVHGDVIEQSLSGLPPVSTLDLTEFDIEDGVAATHMVNAVRLLGSRIPLLQIVGAPQVLAHNLYRTGMFTQGDIELIAMREDEAYG